MSDINAPPRVVGLPGAVLINLNGVVGAGIFALPALLYAGAGNFSPYLILIFALFYACLVAVPAKLSTLFRQSGGPQLYAQHAFGRFVGFQIGWFTLAGNMAGRAANFHVMVAYLAAIFPFFGGPVAMPVTIVSLIVLFAGISLIGMRRSVGALWVGTSIKLAPLLILCAAGLATNGVPTDVQLPQFSEIEALALLLAYAFSGAGTVTVAAGEVTQPRRVVFRSIYLNLAIVAAFYALIQLSYIAIAPGANTTHSPLAAAGEAVLGGGGALLISIAAIFSIGTNQLNSFIAMPRIAYGMGRRGLLPPIFKHLSPRFQTPSVAIIVYSLIVIALAVSGSFAILALLVVSVEQIIMLTMVAALIAVWRRNDGDIAATMDWRWAAIIAIATVMVIWMAMQVPFQSQVSTLALVGIGIVLYLASASASRSGEGVYLPGEEPAGEADA
ncbi:APC family permease [Erythrobacter sp. MTPC3]|uniref:APC family permease n=1 Tax=Erythrobacter sp. MTPC3 TaxID=3056564 RepID=UPI0036F26912